MTREEELLVEKALSSYRRRDPDGAVQVSPAWADLSAENRRIAFDEALKLRKMEAALDPRGRSSTVRAILERIQKTAP
jgi:hypothetical protein